MDLDEVETVVRDALAKDGRLSTESSRRAGYVDILIRLSRPDSADAASRHARIWSSGVEAFFLDVPNGFKYQEFDWEREGQLAVLGLLAALAREYLLGRFQEKEERISFGRQRRYLEIAVGGDSYRLYR